MYAIMESKVSVWQCLKVLRNLNFMVKNRRKNNEIEDWNKTSREVVCTSKG